MKKLLVAAMGIAAAYGAFADPFSVGKRFEGLTVDEAVTTNELNEVSGGTYWTDPVDAANTYTVKEMDGYDGSRPAFFPEVPKKALEVKTTFGQPLKFNFKQGETQTVGEDGLYFDSLVKFTVCDGAPEDKGAYDGAKIMMWLQSDDDTVTNVMIRAGYLTYNAGVVTSVETNYTCGTKDGNFADSWHRVTIKAIADITKGVEVPGFVVFIDEEMVIVPLSANYNVWGDGFPARSDNAKYWEQRKALFPSMIQTADKKLFSAVEFDGTGSLNDVTVTETAPEFAKDKAAPKVEVTIDGESVEEDVKTIEDAVGVINNAKYFGSTAELTLLEGVTLEAPIVFSGEGATTVTLDFAGFVLTNELDGAAITNSAVALTITDSSDAVGGIVCEGAGAAIVQTETGSLNIYNGFFKGQVDLTAAENVVVYGGSFLDDTDLEKDEGTWLAPGKTLVENQETELWDVVDEEPVTKYTVTVDLGENVLVAVTLNGEPIETLASYEVNADDDVTVTYTPASGYVLTGGTAVYEFVDINENKSTTAPTATAATYGITYYNGETPLNLAPATYTYGEGVAVLPSASAATGYQFDGWYDNAGLTGDPVTSIATTATGAKTLYAKFSGKTFTIYTCTNGVVNTSKEFTYAGASVAPADPTFNSETEEWDGKWYTTIGGSTEFAFDAAGETTQYAYATITAKSGGGDWDPDPSKIDESKTAAQEYPALADTPLATANAKKLTVWAKANSVSLSEAETATTALVESYLLNCAPADLEAEKAAFKLDISFDGSGNPVVTLPVGKEYNVTPTMKGSNDLSTWTVIDSTTGYQFFKYELSL